MSKDKYDFWMEIKADTIESIYIYPYFNKINLLK